MALEFTDSNIKEVIESGKPVVIDLWAEWCGPCRMVGPLIEELAEEYTGRVEVGKMNVDENVDTPSEYGIRNIPTVLFKDGELAHKVVGAVSKLCCKRRLNLFSKSGDCENSRGGVNRFYSTCFSKELNTTNIRLSDT